MVNDDLVAVTVRFTGRPTGVSMEMSAFGLLTV